MDQVLQSSRHWSSYGPLVTVKIVNVIVTEEYKLKNYNLLVLIKIAKLILTEKFTLEIIARNF